MPSTDRNADSLPDRLKGADAPPPRSDFAIVATQRTGSTLLEELLGSADDCHVFPELLAVQQPFHVPRRAIRKGFVDQQDVDAFQEALLAIKYGLYRRDHGGPVSLGAHLMWNQISDRLVERLIGRGQKMVFLERDNILAIYRSATFAREKGLSHVRDGSNTARTDKVAYDHARFQRFHQRISDFYARRKALAEKFGPETMTIKYADLARDKTTVVNQVRAFLGLPRQDSISSDLQKRQSANPIDGFSNPDEVRTGIARLGLDHYLQPEY